MSRGNTVATAVAVLVGWWLGNAGAAAAQAGCARAGAVLLGAPTLDLPGGATLTLDVARR